MSESECLTNLDIGARMCLENANRLLEDAEALLKKGSYPSCYLLSQLALEELAKGFKLIVKHLKGEIFSKKDWKNLTKGREAHVKKLEYIQKVRHELVEKSLAGTGVHIKTWQDMIWGKQVSLADLGKYRKEASKALYTFRIDSLYVNYDFEKKQWTDPRNHPILSGASMDAKFCLPNIAMANFYSQVLMKLLKDRKKE
jgi:AbiV family abortive infection protein